VLDHPRTAKVFQKYRIDFCCGGRVTIADACTKRGIAAESVYRALRDELERGEGGRRDPRRMTTAALIAYVVERHHGYLRSALAPVRQMMAKVARVHGAHEPNLVEMHRVFESLAPELEAHLDEEERTLFPKLVAVVGDQASLASELARTREEHAAIGEALGGLRALADDYRVPEWGCATYRSLFAELEALEADVFEHVHLENHVLAPRFEGCSR
jgi:regulator of cell morphogenesis and NO signaling